MCGRYTVAITAKDIIKRFHANLEGTWKPRYNVAPSQPSPVLTDKDKRLVRMFRWGLTPPWWKYKGRSLINVRVESLEKPVFRHSLERRCLVLADSFYEWKKEGKVKVPYRIMRDDGAPFAFAGIWEEDKDAKGKPITSFAILTSTPNEVVAPIHDRMPVMLLPEWENTWIDPEAGPRDLKGAFKPYPAVEMEAYEVSRAVNSPTVDDETLLERVGG